MTIIDLSAFASCDCYGCRGTGRIVGFGNTGRECPCLVRCEECDAPIADRESGLSDGQHVPVTCPACLAARAVH